MPYSLTLSKLEDNGGRRAGPDRRRAALRWQSPENRSHKERRSGKDRRRSEAYGNAMYCRRKTDLYGSFYDAATPEGSLRAVLGLLIGIPFSLLLWGAIVIIWRTLF
jgi:hypothetical protein